MTRYRWRWCGQFVALGSWLVVGGALALGGGLSPIASLGDCALAQITPDGTLGAESSVVTPTNIDGLPTERIDGGATRGANLFHSFEKFSVVTGRAAYFNNAADIQNIISRVTGGSVSNIDGLLRANGTANLFLLNPNGIIFGPNAQLNIGGSFLGSTASSLNFADGSQFSATAPQTTPLLTVSVPLGLQYGGTAGGIQVQQSILQVQTGQTLALVGGDVSLEGGEFGFLSALGGRIELGGLTGAGIVEIEGQQSEGAFGLMSLSFPDSIDRADVLLTNLALVDVAAGGGGSIAINARNIDISGSSELRGGVETDSGFFGATAGDITLNATGAIAITNSDIFNNVRTGGVGKGGNIDITTGSLEVTNGATLNASTQGQGNAGSVNINARDTVSFDGADALVSVHASWALGNGGDINIMTGSLSVTNGGGLYTKTAGEGHAGNVNINARDTVSFDGVSSDIYEISSQANSGMMGSFAGDKQSGDINITTGSLSVTNGAQLVAYTLGQGDAGSVNINARDTVSFDGVGGVLSFSLSGVGNSGDINITTDSLSITNGAGIDASGGGGNITFNANTLKILNGRGVSTTSGSSAKAGNITLNVTDSITLAGSDPNYNAWLAEFTQLGFDINDVARVPASSLSANTTKNSTAQGGDLKITTGQLTLRDGAEVTVSSAGTGAAGNLTVSADYITLDNQSSIQATTATGNQGNITLRSPTLVLRRESEITTNATGTATGGNITLNTDILAALENSDITANSFEAFGGQVIINAQGIFGTEFRNQQTSESDITATSNLGPQFSGTVEINTPDVDPAQGLVNLLAIPIDTEVVQTCTPGGSQAKSEFIITGRGGLPPNPGDALSTDAVQIDLVTLNPEVDQPSTPVVSTSPNSPTPVPIVEAQGWVINNKGEVVLTAHAPTVTPHASWQRTADCQKLNQQPGR